MLQGTAQVASEMVLPEKIFEKRRAVAQRYQNVPWRCYDNGDRKQDQQVRHSLPPEPQRRQEERQWH